jgi:hypothetical protein
MIIHNFNVVRVFAAPAEANAPLVVDADAMLPRSIAFQGFQAVAGRQGQIAQFARAINLRELPQGHALNLRRQAVVTPPLPQPLCFPASEVGNHCFNLSSHDNMSSCGMMHDGAAQIQPAQKILSRFLPASVDVEIPGEIGVHFSFGETNDFGREFDKGQAALAHEIVNCPFADVQAPGNLGFRLVVRRREQVVLFGRPLKIELLFHTVLTFLQ